jgi:hypothetical protein
MLLVITSVFAVRRRAYHYAALLGFSITNDHVEMGWSSERYEHYHNISVELLKNECSNPLGKYLLC